MGVTIGRWRFGGSVEGEEEEEAAAAAMALAGKSLGVFFPFLSWFCFGLS